MTGPDAEHPVIDRVLVLLAQLVAGGSLLLLVLGAFAAVDLHLSDGSALAWDAALSMTFFLQHSLMVRRPFKAWMARLVPARYLGATYAIASGLVFAAVVLLWQRTEVRLGDARGPLRWVGAFMAVLALVGFVWSVASLRHFDPFGVRSIRLHRRGEVESAEFLIRGPYRWVRHPLYLSVLLLLWSPLDLGADRLLMAVLWSAWIVAGTVLEERDLVAELGEPYAAYRRSVPMLFPWRRPARAADGAHT